MFGPAASPIAFAPAPFNLPQAPGDAARPIFHPAPIASATISASRGLNAPVVAEPIFEPRSLPLTSAQSADGYDEWRARMDAARSKRRRGIILTAGGILGGPLVAGTVFAASSNETGARAAQMVTLAGLGAGVWGVFQWIGGHSEIGELELEGRREGYVSITPVPGGAAGTLALSF